MFTEGPQRLQRLREEVVSSEMCHAGRKKLKRRAARDDSSVDSGGDRTELQPDAGNQLVQYQPSAAAGAALLDAFLQPLDGVEANSAPGRGGHPEPLTEVTAPAPALPPHTDLFCARRLSSVVDSIAQITGRGYGGDWCSFRVL